MEGFKEILGTQHLVTLRAITDYLIDEIHPYATPALEKALRVNMDTQRQICPEDTSDSYYTGLMLGLCQFSLMRYREASEVFRQSAEGMHRILGPMNREYLKARMNFGKSLEYLGQVEQAIDIFSGIYNSWKDIHGPETPLSLFSQSCLAMALRKARRYEESEHHTMQCLALRQRIFGMASFTLDTIVHAVVILREMDRKEEAFAYLGLGSTYVGDGTHPDIGIERAHQIQHIRALLHHDLGDSARATRILEDVFIGAKKDNFPECGELMWMRLTLANIFREHHAFEAAEALFAGLVKPIDGDELSQSIIVEGAIRLAQQHDVDSACGHLKQNGLEWRQDNIFRIILGGPNVELHETAKAK
ncbi:hypothetical protein BDV96DRAFT_627983 [Lophiotrema nucula]|uniref:MalT-like TPR region domain-containing protein n=1 Tax=Lophiotrema nucula TaxID=690887 RepID=A0A6A5ZMF4_9PLEO|nr:hypothetical protein BDV96DRAFT_627983 [Lophiotrema nucula]